MNDIEYGWCKSFIASLNGRAPSAAELWDFMDHYILKVSEAFENGYALGYEHANSNKV